MNVWDSIMINKCINGNKIHLWPLYRFPKFNKDQVT